jgi:hypothetical protein
VGGGSDQQRDSLKSFIDATPAGKFNVIDMSVSGPMTATSQALGW